jgi:hypothetical protein
MTSCSVNERSPVGQVKELANGVYGLSYQSTILFRCVQIKIASRLGGTDVIEIKQRLDLAIALVNANEKRLSEPQKKAIRAIKEIQSDPSRHSGASTSRQLYNLRSDYVKSVSTGWLAATFVHDGLHIVQKQRGAVYDESTSSKLEKEANTAMLSVGALFGLSQVEMDSIRRDRHTAYNVPFY